MFVLLSAGCGEGQLRLEGNRVMGPGFRLTVPDGFSSAEVGPPTSARVVGLKGPEGQREAATIRHTDGGPTHPLDEQQCRSEAKGRADLGHVAKELGQGHEVEPWTLVDNPVLGKVCGFAMVSRARSMAFRQFHVRHHGYQVICEADETEQAESLCDGYLATASKP